LSFHLPGKVWAAVIVFLVLVIAAGAVFIIVRIPRNNPIEISLVTTVPSYLVSVDGAVNNPGSYNFTPDQTLDSFLQTAGGVTSEADTGNITIYVPQTGTVESFQKVNINTADSWLLEALPGIGDTLAGRIIEYRNTNGPFRNTNEITKIKSVSLSLYEQIKDLITVGN
jgi:competence protein ComEA